MHLRRAASATLVSTSSFGGQVTGRLGSNRLVHCEASHKTAVVHVGGLLRSMRLELTTPSPLELAQIEAGTDCGRTWPRRAAAAHHAVPSLARTGAARPLARSGVGQNSCAFPTSELNRATSYVAKLPQTCNHRKRGAEMLRATRPLKNRATGVSPLPLYRPLFRRVILQLLMESQSTCES